MEKIEKELKEEYIKKEAREVVNRNKGRVSRYLRTLDDMILFFSILKYKGLTIDLQSLKTQLQMEKVKYRQNNKKKEIDKKLSFCQNDSNHRS